MEHSAFASADVALWPQDLVPPTVIHASQQDLLEMLLHRLTPEFRLTLEIRSMWIGDYHGNLQSPSGKLSDRLFRPVRVYRGRRRRSCGRLRLCHSSGN